MPPTGSRASNRFYRQGNHWYCRTSLPSDIIIEVEAVLFHLHKFPLLSKSGKIAWMLEESHGVDDSYYTMECPGGSDAFYLAVQFCYGMSVELTPKSILTVYSAAEYLEMTEVYAEDNLLAIARSFVHKVLLHSWKDCILALHYGERFIAKAETLPVVSKCLSAISVMICIDLSLLGWPMMMYGSFQSPGGSILWNGIRTGARIRSSESEWWFEDISCLGVPMFKKLMEIMKIRGARPEIIAGAVMYYARKCLPGLDRSHSRKVGKSKSLTSVGFVPNVADQKALVESIETLLPENKGQSYCRFLLGLLRTAMILKVSQPCKNSIERKIGMQLDMATLDGILIPSFSDSDILYDTDCVQQIIQYFLCSQASYCAPFSPSFDQSESSSPTSDRIIRVAKLIDNYLAEIAPDANLKPEKVASLLKALPESLRLIDDGLYGALDIYFKAHTWLSEHERAQLCSIIKCEKLSVDALAHASQNERLPLRFKLQILFFEQLQLRRSISNCLQDLDGQNEPANTANDMAEKILRRDGWVSLVQQNRSLRADMERMRSRVRELEKEFSSIKEGITETGRSHNLVMSARVISQRLGCVP